MSSIDDVEQAYVVAEGYPTMSALLQERTLGSPEQVDDLLSLYLREHGYTSRSVSDSLMEHLTALGYTTGSLGDRLLESLIAGDTFPTDLAAHYDASISDTITIATGVSNWADISGNGRDLVQATGANQPSYANNAITFDGVSDFLKTAAFTLIQPETIYLVMNQVSWTSGRYIFDGDASASTILRTIGTTPDIQMQAGSPLANSPNLAVGADGVVAVVFNGASSSLLVNDTTIITGDAGANNSGGFTLGARATSATPSNIKVYEVAIYSVAHNTATQASIIAGLMAKWGI